MKGSLERFQRNGYSEELRRWVEKWRNEKVRTDLLNSRRGLTYYTLLHFNDTRPYDEGVVEQSDSVIVELGLNRVVEVNVDSHALLRVNGEEVKGIEHAQMLDLSDDGERWEGDVLNNQPGGWGALYDNEGEKKYEGFMIGEVNVCYGTWYYSDIQKVEYEGEWCEGKRWGRGIQYNRKGEVQYDGEWVKDEHLSKKVVLSEENQFLHSHIEELIVNDNCCNGAEWTALDLSFMANLRSLRMINSVELL